MPLFYISNTQNQSVNNLFPHFYANEQTKQVKYCEDQGQTKISFYPVASISMRINMYITYTTQVSKFSSPLHLHYRSFMNICKHCFSPPTQIDTIKCDNILIQT